MTKPLSNPLQLSLGFEEVAGIHVDPVQIPKRKIKGGAIDDFGEKIGGARKDIAAQYLARISIITNDVLASKPLSQVLPRPNLKQIVNDGKLSVSNALWIKFRFDMIPTKPRRMYRVKHWVETVREVIDQTNNILTENPEHDFMQEYIANMLDTGYSNEALHAKTYVALANNLNYPQTDFNVGNHRIVRFYGNSGYGVVKDHLNLGEYKSFDEAVQALTIEVSKQISTATSLKRAVALSIYQNPVTNEIFIGKSIQGRHPIKLIGDFLSGHEARKYLAEHRQDLEFLWMQLSNIPDERRTTNNPRVGKNWRDGKEVTPEMFSETFGFRGVEFGNWVSNVERQTALNEAYDALMDLSMVIKKSPRALSLNGELALAFGARGGGGGNVSAHYEPIKVVINLTKTKGAGSLAHEWFHALDNYFSRMQNNTLGFITDNSKPRRSDLNVQDSVRNELLIAFSDLTETIKSTGLAKRSAALDSYRSKTYWSQPPEMGARVFENYVIERLTSIGASNDYLAQFKPIEEWNATAGGNLDTYPYPLKDESEIINERFDQFFETIQEKINKETHQVLLFKEQTFFSNAENAVLKITQQRAQAKQWLAMLRNNGGVKAAEDRWMGLTEWLSNDTDRVLSKAEVLQFIEMNKIEVNEVLLTNENSYKLEWEQVVSAEFNYYQTVHDDITYIISPEHDVFRIFDLDGVELGSCKSLEAAQAYVEQLAGSFAVDTTRNAQWTTPGVQNLKTMVLSVPNIEAWNQEDCTHYGDIADGKAIAWIRFGETTDKQGRRILLLDEVQSKRHQEGRHFGYRTPAVESEFMKYQKHYALLKEELSRKYGKDITGPHIEGLSDKDRSKLQRASAKMNIEGYVNRVPEAPFEKQWHELAFKRMLRYAAEEGYDTIAWTTGEQQSERYDLSSKLDAVEFSPCNKKGFPGIVTLKCSDEDPQIKYVPNEMELSRIVGKEIAGKIGKGHYNLKGNQLKVGSTGMNGFYDKILVDFADKYGKKWGTKVSSITLPLGDKGESVMHSLEITPDMRKSIFLGQPLFKVAEHTEKKYDNETKKMVSCLVAELSEQFKVPVNLVQNKEDLPPHIIQACNRKRMFSRAECLRLPGVYDPVTGMVHFVLNEIQSTTEASTLFLHEIIAHKGIDGLLGKQRACEFYGRVFDSLDIATQRQLIGKYQNKFVAGAEYVALMAEENKMPSIVERIISFFKDILRAIGLKVEIKNDDIRVMLANSRKYLKKGRVEKINPDFKIRKIQSDVSDMNPKRKMTL